VRTSTNCAFLQVPLGIGFFFFFSQLVSVGRSGVLNSLYNRNTAVVLGISLNTLFPLVFELDWKHYFLALQKKIKSFCIRCITNSL